MQASYIYANLRVRVDTGPPQVRVRTSATRRIAFRIAKRHWTGDGARYIGRTMRFYTQSECEDWLSRRDRVKPSVRADLHSIRVSYPPEAHRFRFLSHWIATKLSQQSDVLLWITEWSIWPSSENWHLYYKLRQGYSDHRLLHEAPGHLFLGYELEDLASFLQIAILNGWGGYVLSEMDYVNVFFSHDEYLDFFSAAEQQLSDVREVWTPQQPALES